VQSRLARLHHHRLPGGIVVAEARSPAARLLGLAGLADLPPHVALRIAPCRSVHTAGMRFALDLVWLDGAGAVVRVDRGVPPWRARTCRRARAVLETRAGGADAVVAAARTSTATTLGKEDGSAGRHQGSTTGRHNVDLAAGSRSSSTKRAL